MQRAKSAFTLIELLVVIAVIAILAAILFPVFAQAREKARQANCLSSLKQISLAMLLYSQDFDGTLPRNRFAFKSSDVCNSRGQALTWRSVIQPYVKSYAFWKCPSNPNRNMPSEDADKNISQSYAANGVIFHAVADPAQNLKIRPRTLASFQEPATSMVLLESVSAFPDFGDWVGNAPGPSGKGGVWCGTNGEGTALGKFQTHGDILNWGFLDGHARALKDSALWQPGLVAPYHDMWDTWEDDSTGVPDQTQVKSGARAQYNVSHLCLYLR